jgi:hypothetical protein
MFGSDAFLSARIAQRAPADSLAGFELGRLPAAARSLAARLIVADDHERQLIWDGCLVRTPASAGIIGGT